MRPTMLVPALLLAVLPAAGVHASPKLQLNDRAARMKQQTQGFSYDLRWNVALAFSKASSVLATLPPATKQGNAISAERITPPDTHGTVTDSRIAWTETMAHGLRAERRRLELNESLTFSSGLRSSERNAIELRGGTMPRVARTERETRYDFENGRSLTQEKIETERRLPFGLRYRTDRYRTVEDGKTTLDSTRRRLSFSL